jgi:hypothetical protein
MPRFSQQVIGALANPQYGMLTGQAIANVGGRLAQIPGNIREEQQRRAAQAAYQTGIAGLQSQDPAAMYNASQGLIAAGQPEQAMQMAELAQNASVLRAETARREALRTNVISRAKALPGFNRMAETAENASAEQLESMRVQLLAEETRRQLEGDQANQAANAAEAAGVSDIFIDLAKDTPDILNEVTSFVLKEKESARLDDIERTRQIKLQLARAEKAELPQSIVDDVEAGVYVGENGTFADILSGKAFSQKNYQVQPGSAINQPEGTLITLPTSGGKVIFQGKMYWPSDLGVVIGPDVTAEGHVKNLDPNKKLSAFVGNDVGIMTAFIEDLDTVADLRAKISVAAGASITPFRSDFARKLVAYQQNIPEVFARIKSGAAIKDDEMPRFIEMFTVTAKELTSPVSAAEKTIRAAALVQVTNDILSGKLTPIEANDMVVQAGAITLSEEDVAEINSGKKGSLKRVVKKYTDPILGKRVEQNTSDVDNILKKLNISVGG